MIKRMIITALIIAASIGVTYVVTHVGTYGFKGTGSKNAGVYIDLPSPGTCVGVELLDIHPAQLWDQVWVSVDC